MKWLLASRPPQWLALLDTDLKRDFVEEARSQNTTTSAADPEAAAAEWRAFLELPDTVASDPLTDAQREAFTDAVGVEMPVELEAILRVANGAANANVEFMGSEQIIQTWQGWQDIFDDWTLEDLTSGYRSPTGEAVGVYWCPGWIPLLDERSGNHPAIDLIPGPKGTRNQIVYAGAEESFSLRIIATDLADFIRQQREHLSAEGYDRETDGDFY